MRLICHFNNNIGRGFYLFHRGILTFFCLIFLSACGYKGEPTYTSYEQNGSIKSIKKYEILNRW
ncbi:hypothetical protein CVU9913_00395 [Campylobacter vulpis]|nr:hypothetical protein [Campylobacter vulpis]MBS4268994.1 hypothetical protein [Campylobacter vulpis]MBS4312943.1 hypothetical protein [Campylobacter vulpis]